MGQASGRVGRFLGVGSNTGFLSFTQCTGATESDKDIHRVTLYCDHIGTYQRGGGGESRETIGNCVLNLEKESFFAFSALTRPAEMGTGRERHRQKSLWDETWLSDKGPAGLPFKTFVAEGGGRTCNSSEEDPQPTDPTTVERGSVLHGSETPSALCRLQRSGHRGCLRPGSLCRRLPERSSSWARGACC